MPETRQTKVAGQLSGAEFEVTETPQHDCVYNVEGWNLNKTEILAYSRLHSNIYYNYIVYLNKTMIMTIKKSNRAVK